MLYRCQHPHQPSCVLPGLSGLWSISMFCWCGSLNWSKMVSKLKYVLAKLHLNCLFSQFSSWGSRASTGVKTQILNCHNSVLIICNSVYYTVLSCNTVVPSILCCSPSMTPAHSPLHLFESWAVRGRVNSHHLLMNYWRRHIAKFKSYGPWTLMLRV